MYPRYTERAYLYTPDRDAKLRALAKLNKALSIARLQKNKHLCHELERRIANGDYR